MKFIFLMSAPRYIKNQSLSKQSVVARNSGRSLDTFTKKALDACGSSFVFVQAGGYDEPSIF
jgi:hypothetical protein